MQFEQSQRQAQNREVYDEHRMRSLEELRKYVLETEV